MLGQLGIAPRPSNSEGPPAGNAANTPANAGPPQGCLARPATTAMKDYKTNAMALVRAIQSAGVTDRSFCKSVKKMGIEPEDGGGMPQETPIDGEAQSNFIQGGQRESVIPHKGDCLATIFPPN